MSELLKEMGQRILERRKQLNMTQETLAKFDASHIANHLVCGNGAKSDAPGNHAEDL